MASTLFTQGRQDSFIDAGEGGGIGFGLAEDITNAVINEESIVDRRIYHTIYELKMVQVHNPSKLHMAGYTRPMAAATPQPDRYTIYVYMTDLHDLTKVIYKPAGYLIAPQGEEYR